MTAVLGHRQNLSETKLVCRYVGGYGISMARSIGILSFILGVSVSEGTLNHAWGVFSPQELHLIGPRNRLSWGTHSARTSRKLAECILLDAHRPLVDRC